MVRVIYRWRVAPQNLAAFKREWTIATNKIHDTIPGAMGSFMLRESATLEESHNPEEILTIAKWQDMAAWQTFWGMASPPEMESMNKLGERLSATAYDELDDFTR